ncbi:hypothetical protein SAY87_011385 [Trapa incisa]|uniref:Pentatricopeptide repeat-containing protein n=1 Tax=Trapa incisa TaxID=236973 RepID=A0AAN7JJ52_9MYRT|nr:hypothetical protein SAY87_011385 [Trapa incisa]
MFSFSKPLQGLYRTSVSCFSDLIDMCVHSRSQRSAKIFHAQLIKFGLINDTFLGNRCLDMYTRFGVSTDVLRYFDELPRKKLVSWNICLKGMLKLGEFTKARKLFDEMPQRDVVSWNSMISTYSSVGLVGSALNMFLDMQKAGLRPSEFTYSMLASLISCANQGKQIHGNAIINGVNPFCLVLGNSLIDMYGKLYLPDFSLAVLTQMQEVDIISWNSLMLAFHISGQSLLSLEQLRLITRAGLSPDKFTLSLVTTICSTLQDLVKDWNTRSGSLKKSAYGILESATP